MPSLWATVIIPTLHGGEKLARCLAALRAQTYPHFNVIVVDNSGSGQAREFAEPPRVCVTENPQNVGFGAAVNQAIAASSGDFILTLNDDAYAAPRWVETLVAAANEDPKVGMCASQIRLSADQLDSAGLAIYGDGTTKQRGNGRSVASYADSAEVLLPSGCAALYRRSMLAAIGNFDPDYFLYGEDADVGLRGRLAGWRCVYVPEAVVEHDYSSTAGRASSLKAYYVERNRLYTVCKVFPAFLWPLTPWYALWRYMVHFGGLLFGRGLAAEYRSGGEKWWRLVLIVGSAHWDALRHLPDLLEKRRLVRKTAAMGDWAFGRLLWRHRVSAREVAWQ